jgi:radical SAM protein with 4Fe4S-binding SPASM domain
MVLDKNKFEVRDQFLGNLINTNPLDSTDYYVVAHRYSRRWMVVNSKMWTILKSIAEKSYPREITQLELGITSQVFEGVIKNLKEYLDITHKGDAWVSKIEEEKSFIPFTRPDSISIDLTTECNLTCRHCYLSCSPNQGDFMESDLVFQMLDDLKRKFGDTDCINIRYTGGEPLLHPKLKELVSYTRRNNFPVTIVTNGVLLTKDKLDFFDEHDVGIFISLEGGTETVHDSVRGVGSFRKLNRILICIRDKYPDLLKRLNIYISIHKGCIPEIKKIIALVKELGVKTVGFQPLGYVGRAREHADLFPTDDEVLRAYEYISLAKRANPDLNIIGNIKDDFSPFGFEDQREICRMGRDIKIDTAGNIQGCTMLLDPAISLGNLRDTKITSVKLARKIDDMNYSIRDKRNSMIVDCQRCIWKNFCYSGCLAKAYCTFGDFWHPAPGCGVRKKVLSNSVRQHLGI